MMEHMYYTSLHGTILLADASEGSASEGVAHAPQASLSKSRQSAKFKSAISPKRRHSMKDHQFAGLTYPLMPPSMEQALTEFGLMKAFHKRPSDQRDEYIAWVAAAGEGRVRDLRLAQILEDLDQGVFHLGAPAHEEARQDRQPAIAPHA